MIRIIAGLFLLCCPFVCTSQAIIIADSVSEFSSTQGQDNWYYGYYVSPFTSATFEQMDTYDSGINHWYDQDLNPGYPMLWSSGGIPGFNEWAVRRWISDVAGEIAISGTVANSNPPEFQCGDGTTGRIFVDGEEVWNQYISGYDAVGVYYSINIDVNVGTIVDFAIDPYGSTNWCDQTTFTAVINSEAGTAATVNIDLDTTHQTIRGFGGITFRRWDHGLQNDAQVDTAFGNGPDQIGLTILRIDVPPDNNYNTEHGDYNWNLSISAAQRAKSHGAIVFASPWTPPPSMKTNGSTIWGELSPGSYGAFANYLSDFANAMEANGVSLYAISVQNEPDYSPDPPGYESCLYSATQMQTFLNNNASVIPTRMMAPETTGFNSSYMNTVASSSECDVVACHIYGGNGYYSYPGKEYWQTEHCTWHYYDPNVGNLWPDALNVGKEIHDCMTNNMNAYIWWYIRRFYGPMGEDGSITKRGYCMSHFAKFARPGSTRVSATASPTSGVYVTAYKSCDNLVIVAVNQNSSSIEVTFSVSGSTVSSYTKYETSSSNSLSNMGSVGSTDTLAGYSISTFVGTIGSGIPGDLNEDFKVDFIDLAILGQCWPSPCDIYTLADIADNWLYGT